MTDVASTYRTILTERIDGVLRITLNRPERRNAMSPELQDELIHAVGVAQYDKSIHVILIRGAGPSFCSGYDLAPDPSAPPREGYGGPLTIEDDVALCLTFGEKWGKLWHSRIPVIAQIHGYCVAGGTDLALHCDMIIAADDAKLGFPPVRAQGSPPTHMWVYHAGPQWAKRLLLTGDTITGKKAAEVGLVLESVPAGELDDYALALATRVSLVGHDLLVHNKRIVNLAVELMGRGTMQMLAAITDTLAHNAPEAFDFNDRLRNEGLHAALAERDGKFA